MKTHHGSPRRKGFTLIELMVAMTITAIIVGVLVTITGTAIDTWNRSRDELRASRQAESMINMLTKDLESLVVRSDRPQEWLSAILQDPGDRGASTNASRFVFFTAATDRYDGMIGVTGVDMGGDISCAGYRLDWKDPVTAGTTQYETFVLSRHLVDPDDTFTTLLGQTDDTNTLDVLFTNNYGTVMDQNRNFVCENVFQFTLVFHVDVLNTDGDLETRLISVSPGGDGMSSFRVKHNSIIALDNSNMPVTEIQNGTLTAVEVSLTVLTDNAIIQLRQQPARAENSDWVKQNGFHFSRLIQVPRK